eukprot:1488771-Amphidinium_carterae.1
MEGLNNPRFNMCRQTQATNTIHGLLKSAHTLLLNWIPPAGPLSVHPKISGSDLHGGQETGTPGLLQLVFSVRTIADDNRLFRIHLHVGLSQGFKHTFIAVTQIVREVRSGRDQDHVVHIFTDLNMSSGTLQSAYQERM